MLQYIILGIIIFTCAHGFQTPLKTPCYKGRVQLRMSENDRAARRAARAAKLEAGVLNKETKWIVDIKKE